MGKSDNHIRNAAIAIMSITLFYRVMGFVKNTILAYYFGTSPVVDAYVMVFSIGGILFGWMSGFTGNFTPHYKYIWSQKGKAEANSYTIKLLNWLLLITFFVFIIFELFSSRIIHFMAPGYKGVTYDLTLHFWKIYCITIFLSVLYRIYKEYLICNELFIRAHLPDIFVSLSIIIFIYLSTLIGQEFLIWGFVLAMSIQCLMEYGFSKKLLTGVKKYTLEFDENIKQTFVTALPVILAEMISELNSFVDKMFASKLTSGTVAILEYSNLLKMVIYDTGVIALGTILFPKLAETWSLEQKEEFKSQIIHALNLMTVMFLPITFGIFAIGDLVVKIIFERGEFSFKATIMTAIAWKMYSIGLLGMVFMFVLNKAYLSMRKTKTVFMVNTLTGVLNVILDFVLIGKMGYIGLALATSVASIIGAITYTLFISIDLDDFHIKEIFSVLICTFVSSLFMFLCIIGVRSFFTAIGLLNCGTIGTIISLIVLILFGGLSYFGGAKLLNIQELDYYVKAITSIIIKT